MARRLRIRLVRDDLGALDLLSIGGFHVTPHAAPNPRKPRWRRWRRRAKPAGRKPLTGLLPILARKIRERRGRHDSSGLNRPH